MGASHCTKWIIVSLFCFPISPIIIYPVEIYSKLSLVKSSFISTWNTMWQKTMAHIKPHLNDIFDITLVAGVISPHGHNYHKSATKIQLNHNVSWEHHSWLSYAVPIVFLCFSYECSMIFLWCFYVFPLNFLWFSYDFHMMFLWFSVPMSFLRFPAWFPTMWGPQDISWFISPSNYSYKYHKP